MDSGVVIIGAGPAGLATAAELVDKGVNVTLLERGTSVGTSWRAHYDGLRLNTVRWFSHLPGLRIPSRAERWVSRDDFVKYLEQYAIQHGLHVEPNINVLRIDAGRDGNRRWLLLTDKGPVETSSVVVATGPFDVPVTPAWRGLRSYQGEICHAADYNSPEPYVGRSVLVVGAGASGLEIATLLSGAGAAPVYLSVRSCQNLFPREWCGIPLTPVPVVQRLPAPVLDSVGAAIHRLLGRDWPNPLPRPRAGLGTALRRDGREPVVADGIVTALRAGIIRIVPGVQDLLGDEVLLADGSKLRPSAVITATGYTHGLESLVGHLGLLGHNGLPIVPDGGRIPHAPGLAFVGFEPTVTGRLLQLPRQAKRAARTVMQPQK